MHHSRNLALRTLTESMGINITEGQDHTIVTPLCISICTHTRVEVQRLCFNACMSELPMCVAPFIIVLSRFIVSVACLSSASSTSGHTERAGSYRQSIKDDCWCVNVIRNFEKGKIIAWAWLSRGLVSPELLTEWRHGGDYEKFKETMKQVMSFVSKECIHMHVRPSHLIRDTTHQSLGFFSTLACGCDSLLYVFASMYRCAWARVCFFLCVSRLIRTFPSCHLALQCSCTRRV